MIVSSARRPDNQIFSFSHLAADRTRAEREKGRENQIDFLGHVVDNAHFPDERFLGVNIRGMNNEQARAAILETVGRLLAKKNEL